MKCVEVYKELYHQEPFDVAFCPYRISPLGAHIDHQYGKINGLAIDKGIHMAYHPKQNGVVELQSLNFPKRAQFFVNAVPEEKQGDWADHLRGAAKMLGEKYRLKVGLSGIIEGSLPIGGLSSSASVIICFLSALCKVNGIHLEPMEMILTAKAAENQYVGVACGKLDQSCEVLSKKNHLLYLDTKDDSYELIPTSEKMKPYKVAIFFSGLERSLKNSKYNLRQDECKAAAYAELQSLLTVDEYKEARASTLNAFYTSPTVIKAMYEALGNMGLSKGNVLEPSCGVGNFMGLVPDSMEKIRMYGVELDSISGRIAQQLYQKNKIAVQGFETMQFPDSFFDCVVGNVPFGNYKVPDKRYDRHNFLIHDYFIAKSLDLVRPGGVVAVVTSSGTMDKKDSSVREYLANRADLVGAIRLPNNAFQRNANTGVVADILFLQKRDRAAVERADWVDLGETPEGYSINQYFAQHPEMVLGKITTESTQYGKQETTVKPIEGVDLAQQLKEAVSNIHATITEPEIFDDELDALEEPIPADPSVKNFSFTNVDGQIYYRENSFMNKVELPAVTAERVLGMIALRETTRKLLDCQLHDGSDAEVQLLQNELKQQYTAFKAQYGLINSTANKRACRTLRKGTSTASSSRIYLASAETTLKQAVIWKESFRSWVCALSPSTIIMTVQRKTMIRVVF